MAEMPFGASHIKKGEALLKQGKVGQVLFSEGTYQIEVSDPQSKTAFWPFLQLDDEGKLLDAFCSCKSAEKGEGCPHLAAAYLQIFNKKSEPLHVRFRESFWNQLCQIAARRQGFEADLLKTFKEKGYQSLSVTGKQLFWIRPKSEPGRKKIEEMLWKRPVETEETSLKFSNLSAEELALWKEGRPSFQLQYELSFWSDLAKWWMILQEREESYSIKFTEEDGGLPKWIQVRFPGIEAAFYISEVNWPSLIASLTTVDSPLAVHEFKKEGIKSIRYDVWKQELLIDFVAAKKEEIEKPEQPGIRVGEWLYVKEQGFYPARVDPLLQESVIPKNKIPLFLQRHPKVIDNYLVGTKVHRGGIKARYHLFFDDNSNLHITCYAFEKGDLQEGHAANFGSWVYLDDKGFYLLEDLSFEGIEKIIPKEKVSDFVSRHRAWLHNYEGFETHVAAIESRFTYSLTPQRVLKFETLFEVSEEAGELLDFGDWVYVKERGFYAKQAARSGLVLKSGLEVQSEEIAHFIAKHKEELEGVQGFFTPNMPLEKTGLQVTLNDKEQIVVTPLHFFKEGFPESKAHFFGDYLYIDREGFAAIPTHLRLPETCSQQRVIDPKAEPYFIAFELDTLYSYISAIDKRLQKPKEIALQIKKLKRDSKAKVGQWLVELTYQTDIGSVPVVEIWKALQQHKRYLFSDAGLIIFKPPRFNWLKTISKKRWSKGGKELRLTSLEWLKLTVFEPIKQPQGTSSEAIATRNLIEEFQSFRTPEPIRLEGLASLLRPYQEIGVNWLWFLYCQGLSGLLCDEMGLGKTHQAMGLLAAAFNATGEAGGKKYLVICPTSVIYHWEDLLKRFLPTLRVLVFYGTERTLATFATDYDLLLTSYGTLRSEKKELSKISFDIAIFDEMQVAKNAHSQTHKALRQIDAKMRLGLTGTPIENRLLELKSLFDLIVPSYFPAESLFRELFVNPIEKNQDEEKKALLARMIKPFLLRRKKAEVLLELPEKIEEIAYCALSDEQKKLYRESYRQHYASLLAQLKDESQPMPLGHIFSLLSTLKQICDHPCLISKELDDYKKHASGKWDLFVELLQEIRDSGQKVVIFSQYLDMLDIIEKYLTEQKIGFAGIRGSTRDRKAELDKFRDDPSCIVFVGSLQAAGVGIDLIAASVVIHYDRWWNPAKENQATDRVHRMGQRRGVQVFKMVTKGTIEEHIHQLIEKKMSLLEGVIGFDDHDEIKGLDRGELIQILQLISYDANS